MRVLMVVVGTAAVVAFHGVTTRAEDQAITWTNLVNATVDSTGTILQKTSGCDGCSDAGASSQQELAAGDGYVEFAVGEAGTFWMAGLSQGDDGTAFDDIDFAFRFNGAGSADVLENGVYQGGADTTYAPGDVFRVAVVNGRVQYFKNGQYLKESAKAPQYPLVLDASLASMGATIRDANLGFFPPPPPGGGFVEKAGSPALRPRFTPAEIAAFLPPAGNRGGFTFPAPYHTDAVRLTNASDCVGGSDCLWYVGYSYWRNINNHVASADMYIVLGTDTNRGGVGPMLLRYNKVNEDVQNLGPLFEEASPYRLSTGEGWYFSGTQPTKLYTALVGGTQLRRYDILTRQFDALAAVDLARCPRPRVCPADAAYIIQAHSSDDDVVHSATLQNSAFQRLGCVVVRGHRWLYFAPPRGHSLDECHVDKSGRWLMLLEERPDGARTNRIVDLRNGTTVVIDAVEGALGHLDMGHGYAVGADTFNPQPNATILLEFPVTSASRPIGPVVHYNKRWDIVAANHVAHGNAKPGLPAASHHACGSNASRVPDMADEIVCFSLDPARNPDGSLDVLIVGQVLTDLDALGGSPYFPDDYAKLPKGNLDVTGRYFLWTANLGGNRLDALLVKIPAESLPGITTSSLRRGRRGRP